MFFMFLLKIRTNFIYKFYEYYIDIFHINNLFYLFGKIIQKSK